MIRRLLFAAIFVLCSVPIGAAQLVVSDDGTRLTFGAAPDAAARIALKIERDGERGDGTIEVTSLDNGARATITLTDAQLNSLRMLVAPAGGYRIAVRAAHHRGATRTIRAGGDFVLGAIVLPVAPVLSGEVRRRDGTALAGAHVRHSETETVTTDARGRFRIEATSLWPRELVVSSQGWGTKYVDVPIAQSSTALPAIVLDRGASIRVNVRRHGERGPLAIALARRDDEAPLRWRIERRLAASTSAATIDDLDAGVYSVVVNGSQPLQRLSGIAGVAAGESRSVTLELTSAVAHGRITVAGVPLANADVTLQSVGNGWSISLTTGTDGEFTSAIWEQGLFTAAIRRQAGSTPHIARVRLTGTPLAELAIDIPDRSVRGRVIDERGLPVSGAQVSIRSAEDEFSRTVITTSDERGEFDFFGVGTGAQSLVVFGTRYLRPDRVPFTLGDADREKVVDVTLREGFSRQFEVAGPHGTPSTGALLVVASDGHLRATAYTDAQGRAEIATPAGERSTLYVFPKEGSLVIRSLVRADDDAATTTRLVVPVANSSLELATLTTDGGAVPDVSLLMRYNGELLPPEVAAELQRQQGFAFATDEHGIAKIVNIPAGVYEFWPFRSEAEVNALVASASAISAPIVVNVVTGENKATVRFRKK